MRTGIAYGGPHDGEELSSECSAMEFADLNPEYDPLTNGITLDNWGSPIDGKGNRPVRILRYEWRNARWEYVGPLVIRDI